ncbi:hypothetical protein CHS0354_022238 [Potamilus streckersoni]|uniref:Uncharacterized protein n=1 Tax=Potamilus streckersoni TaxID=2493646 RepID=A0AAE0WDM1_9BIVA|nr:hypothetical protein CHS0354_022238 [Potamilus streckersoni]
MAFIPRNMSTTNFYILFFFICIQLDPLAGGHDQTNHMGSISSEAQRDGIKKLCYSEDEQLTSNISPIQRPVLFGVGTCGELSILETHVYFTRYHINTASHYSRLSDSITGNVHKHYKNKTDILYFPRRVYIGYLHHSMGEFSILGIENLFARTSDGTSHNISYKLDGKGCEDFKLNTFQNNGREELFVKYRHHMPDKKYHLTVLAEELDGRKGHTHLWIYPSRSLLKIDAVKFHIENITNRDISNDINSTNRCLALDIDQKGSRRKDRFLDNLKLKVFIRATVIFVPLCLTLLLTNIIMCLHSYGLTKQPSLNNLGIAITVNHNIPNKGECLVKESTAV